MKDAPYLCTAHRAQRWQNVFGSVEYTQEAAGDLSKSDYAFADIPGLESQSLDGVYIEGFVHASTAIQLRQRSQAGIVQTFSAWELNDWLWPNPVKVLPASVPGNGYIFHPTIKTSLDETSLDLLAVDKRRRKITEERAHTTYQSYWQTHGLGVERYKSWRSLQISECRPLPTWRAGLPRGDAGLGIRESVIPFACAALQMCLLRRILCTLRYLCTLRPCFGLARWMAGHSHKPTVTNREIPLEFGLDRANHTCAIPQSRSSLRRPRRTCPWVASVALAGKRQRASWPAPAESRKQGWRKPRPGATPRDRVTQLNLRRCGARLARARLWRRQRGAAIGVDAGRAGAAEGAAQQDRETLPDRRRQRRTRSPAQPRAAASPACSSNSSVCVSWHCCSGSVQRVECCSSAGVRLLQRAARLSVLHAFRSCSRSSSVASVLTVTKRWVSMITPMQGIAWRMCCTAACMKLEGGTSVAVAGRLPVSCALTSQNFLVHVVVVPDLQLQPMPKSTICVVAEPIWMVSCQFEAIFTLLLHLHFQKLCHQNRWNYSPTCINNKIEIFSWICRQSLSSIFFTPSHRSRCKASTHGVQWYLYWWFFLACSWNCNTESQFL